MQFPITGAVTPTVAMCWMSDSILMDTHAGGGFFDVFGSDDKTASCSGFQSGKARIWLPSQGGRA
jgi:hypothetical protein